MRVTAAALLAVGTLVPLDASLATATGRPVTVADATTACLLTVGTATTDPARATDAARAIAAGYVTTDCMPDEALLAAAEARAALPLGGGNGVVTGGAVVATSSGTGVVTGSAPAVTGRTGGTGTATAASLPTSTTAAAATTTTATSTPTSTSTSTSTHTSTAAATTTKTATKTSTPDSGDNGNSGNSGNSDTGGDPTSVPVADGTTAAGLYGWGTAQRAEDFTGDLSAWGVYNGPGHDGKGRRSPSAMSVANGIFTINGDAAGTTGGMAWGNGSRYGRWEARVQSPAGDPTYNAVMLLWPDAENTPIGGEIDFMEIGDETRQKTDFFLHYGTANKQLNGQVQIDATQWHNWAVEWAPDHITAFVDGQPWYTTTRTDAFPPGPMHLTLQLDWFPKGSGTVQPSSMNVDWVRFYPIDGSGPSGAITNSDGGAVTGGTGTGSTTGTSGGTSTGDSGGSSGSVAGTTTTTTVTRTATATATSSTSADTVTSTSSASAARAAVAQDTATVTSAGTATPATTTGSTAPG